MGKIKEFIHELAEQFNHILQSSESWYEAINKMHAILSPDEWDFFNDHMDIIKEIIHIDADSYPTNEARGVKGDVLRPYGGRRARTKIGYGKGNRANFNPEDEIDSEEEILRQEALMQDVEDSYMEAPDSKFIDGEEIFDIPDDSENYPDVTDEDYYDQYDLGPGDGIMKSFRDANESIKMPSLMEYNNDELIDDYRRDDPAYVEIERIRQEDGKLKGVFLRKNSREYKRWAWENREWGDDPEDHRQRRRY